MLLESESRKIAVQAESYFVPERSNPLAGRYLFAYNIHIANEGPRTVTLVSRHWIITDAFGRVEEVKGLGVVGEQPRLEPGESFDYTSACPLGTQSGTMRGFYHLIDEAGSPFAVRISPFELLIHASLN